MTHYDGPLLGDPAELECKAKWEAKMTVHPHGVEMNVLRDLEDALRTARAASHERKLDLPLVKSLGAIIDFGHAAVAAFRAQERELGQARKDIATLQALASQRVHSDP